MGADPSSIPCGTGEWFDQHSAWNAYGPVLARALNAQWHLSSESGIGLVHSCCDKPYVLPQVYDKMNFGDNEVVWDYQRYQPDIVSICLGQNDGIQDSLVFCQAYIRFVDRLHGYYPSARFLFLSSPMADAPLRAQQIRYLGAISREVEKKGIKNAFYIFNRSMNDGCTYHPSAAQHLAIARELEAPVAQLLKK